MGVGSGENWGPQQLQQSLVVRDVNSWRLGFTFPSFRSSLHASLPVSAKLALDINAASWTIKEWKKRTALFYSMHRTTELKVQKNCRCRGKGRTAWTSWDNKYVQGEKKKKKNNWACVYVTIVRLWEYFSLWRHDWLPEVSGSRTILCHFPTICHRAEVTCGICLDRQPHSLRSYHGVY